MNVALSPEIEKQVNESVERGEFTSPEDFFQQAVELLLDLRRDDVCPTAVAR